MSDDVCVSLSNTDATADMADNMDTDSQQQVAKWGDETVVSAVTNNRVSVYKPSVNLCWLESTSLIITVLL